MTHTLFPECYVFFISLHVAIELLLMWNIYHIFHNVEYLSYSTLAKTSRVFEVSLKHFMRRNHRQRSALNQKCIIVNNTKLELDCSFLPHTCPRFLFRTCWPDSLMSAPSSSIGHLGLLNYFRAVYFMKRNNLENLSCEEKVLTCIFPNFCMFKKHFFFRFNKCLPTNDIHGHDEFM